METRNVKVVKFGGSSLADAKQLLKAKAIIEAESERCYVVPSAPGKRFEGDIKVTDMLYECYRLASEGEDFSREFDLITERYNGIIGDLGLDLDLSPDFEKIKGAFLYHAGSDYAASRGEYLNGKIMAKLLDYDFIDAAKVIKFYDNGTFDAEKTNIILSDRLSRHERAVVPGFYGSMPNGTIKTFARGGSDVTGSIVARAVGASLYENWTDVSGFLMADPRLVKDPCSIDTITYQELRELSYMGAGVLHEDSIFPVRFAGIPINIKNTNDPSAPGTMIVPKAESFDSERVITGIAGKKGFSSLRIEKDKMNAEIGFGRKVLEAIEEEGITFEHLPSGIDTMSIVVSSDLTKKQRKKIINNISAACEPDYIAFEDGLALLAVVGRGMVSAKGTAARVFKAIAEADINIRMIDQGSSEISIIIGVDEKDLTKALNAIYKEFVK
ncbi:MAG: aspartate kinase [Ruminococcaceae bacterium]|nr:aspartate kinase [Oscillospiraceae bacterium]